MAAPQSGVRVPQTSSVAGEGACGPPFFGWEHTEGGCAYKPSGLHTGTSLCTTMLRVGKPEEQRSRSFGRARNVCCSLWTASLCSASGWHVAGVWSTSGSSRTGRCLYDKLHNSQARASLPQQTKNRPLGDPGACGPPFFDWEQLFQPCCSAPNRFKSFFPDKATCPSSRPSAARGLAALSSGADRQAGKLLKSFFPTPKGTDFGHLRLRRNS